jgi:hypothetical protein
MRTPAGRAAWTQIQAVIPEIEAAYQETVSYLIEIERLSEELDRIARASGNERLAGIVREAKRDFAETMADNNTLRGLLGTGENEGPNSSPDILSDILATSHELRDLMKATRDRAQRLRNQLQDIANRQTVNPRAKG